MNGRVPWVAGEVGQLVRIGIEIDELRRRADAT